MIILDNASKHHNQELKDMCQEAGVLLEYLPPYLPDLNPIDTLCAVLNSWIRRHQDIAQLYEDDNELRKERATPAVFSVRVGYTIKGSQV